MKQFGAIDLHIKAFNTQDNKLFFSMFGDTTIVIDGIAPFRWLNPSARANWIVDVEKWPQDLGVTKACSAKWAFGMPKAHPHMLSSSGLSP
jgi:hypothetical protein